MLDVLDALDRAGVSHWVAGGWGVDVLVGIETRPHRDLDLAVDAEGYGLCMATLEASATPWRRTGFHCALSSQDVIVGSTSTQSDSMWRVKTPRATPRGRTSCIRPRHSLLDHSAAEPCPPVSRPAGTFPLRLRTATSGRTRPATIGHASSLAQPLGHNSNARNALSWRLIRALTAPHHTAQARTHPDQRSGGGRSRLL